MTAPTPVQPLYSLARALRRARKYARKYLARAHRTAPEDERLPRIRALEAEVQRLEPAGADTRGPPVVFFITSVHTNFINLAAGVELLTAWSLRLSGTPVRYFVCKRGVSQCVLGANRHGVLTPPPCDTCIAFRREIYPARHTSAFTTAAGDRPDLSHLSLEELSNYEQDGLKLGALCLPSLRWVERRHRLQPTDYARTTLAQFVSSAAALAVSFDAFLADTRPHAVVLFNGTHYPEAVVRHVAVRRGVRVVTFETGLTEISAFFSHGVATEYQIDVPGDFVFGPAERAHLDEYMAARSKGNFTMAGRRIWSAPQALPPELQERLDRFRDVVTIFSNVTWDTSQAYAHAFFTDMFDWLGCTLERASGHRDTLFVVRAHPDESRRDKPSNETTGDWLRASGFGDLPNVLYIPGDSQMSSYELIDRSKFTAVYNSTVGLEAAAMGRVALAGGHTRYANARVGHHVRSREDYERILDGLLACEGPIVAPAEWAENARRFFYFSLFRASLDFAAFLRPASIPDFSFGDFDATALHPTASRTLAVIRDGIVLGSEFHL